MGIFPWQLMFERNKTYQNLYNLYSKLILSYYMYVTVSMWLALVFLCLEDTLRIPEITKNITVSVICTVTIIRLFVMKLHPAFLRNITFIIDAEQYILSSNDAEVHRIYKNCKIISNRHTIFFIVLSYLMALFISLRPFFTDAYEINYKNESLQITSLPLSIWVPLNEQEHFLSVYFWNVLNNLVMTSIVLSIDIITFLLLIYPVGQLQILHHILSKFENYKNRMKLNYPGLDDDTIGAITLKACIDLHRNIIAYVDDLNACMNIFMVVDFAQSSLLLTSVFAQLLWVEPSITFYGFVFMYVTYLNQRLFMNYYYSNEVWLLSENLNLSVWKSNWYEQSHYVKFMIYFFIMRTRKSLKFKIGPFGFMNLSTYIAILKASYSYIALLHSTQK
ncbi:odorant receptor 30a [Dendroctonus ponderosae]|nr:odorant receptor 30a [Dendroctonus ponderosae]